MKPITQVKSHTVCINGWVLPINALYGNVYGQTYACTDFTPVQKNGREYYNIRVLLECGWRSDTTWKYGAIYKHIRDFMKRPEFVNESMVFCAHKHVLAQKERAREKARENQKRREEYREAREVRSICPKERRAGGYNYKVSSQYSVDGKEYSRADRELRVVESTERAVSVRFLSEMKDPRERTDAQFRRFEMGQNTSGDGSPISDEMNYGGRSSEEHKDHFKHDFSKYRPVQGGEKVKDFVKPWDPHNPLDPRNKRKCNK